MAALSAFAQGGPPMITDDPGTPGPGKWENNIAIAFEHRSDETSYDLPEIDLNYGVGEHIQLTLQTAPVLLKRDDHGPIGGLGGTEAAVKWRFVDEEKSGFDVSMFPRMIFNIHAIIRAARSCRRRHAISNSISDRENVWTISCRCGIRPVGDQCRPK